MVVMATLIPRITRKARSATDGRQVYYASVVVQEEHPGVYGGTDPNHNAHHDTFRRALEGLRRQLDALFEPRDLIVWNVQNFGDVASAWGAINALDEETILEVSSQQ